MLQAPVVSGFSVMMNMYVFIEVPDSCDECVQ
jgi:hypothetical protein